MLEAAVEVARPPLCSPLHGLVSSVFAHRLPCAVGYARLPGRSALVDWAAALRPLLRDCAELAGTGIHPRAAVQPPGTTSLPHRYFTGRATIGRATVYFSLQESPIFTHAPGISPSTLSRLLISSLTATHKETVGV